MIHLNTYQCLTGVKKAQRVEKRAWTLATDPARSGNHLLRQHPLETTDPLGAVSTSSASLNLTKWRQYPLPSGHYISLILTAVTDVFVMVLPENLEATLKEIVNLLCIHINGIEQRAGAGRNNEVIIMDMV